MSSVFVLAQHDAVYLMCDAAGYMPDGILTTNNATKCVAVPTISAAVACTGAIENSALFATNLGQIFASFDQLVSHGERWLPEIFERHSACHRGGDASSSLYIIGWSAERDRPEAYAIDLWTDGSTRVEQIIDNSANGATAKERRSKLILQDGIAGTPLPGMELIRAAGFQIREDDAYSPELDLFHLTEIARHEEIEGRHWVGGAAMLTSIDRRGVSQRVVHRWSEDAIGELIRPLPIDWKTWRAEREAAKGPVQLSRLQREMAERKAAKAARRAGR